MEPNIGLRCEDISFSVSRNAVSRRSTFVGN